VHARYLTIDCLLAEIKIKSYGADRLSSLREASNLFESFLTRLDHYGLLVSSDRELYERFREQQSSFRIVASNNAEDKRRIKIARYQAGKELERQLKVRGHHSLFMSRAYQ
jgi:immunoglobulin-binding protein 1